MTRAGLRVGSAIACVWTIGVADTHAQRLPVRCYGEADGLVQSSVTVAFQDRRGFLWIGTHDGLSRFDGSQFVSYDTTDGLVYGFITAIAEDARGDMWAGTTNGLAYLDEAAADAQSPGRGRWREHALPGVPPGGVNIGALTLDTDGRLWAATSAGVYRADPRSATPGFTRVAGVDGPASGAYADRRGRVWLRTRDRGLMALQGDAVIASAGPPSLMTDTRSPASIDEGRDGVLRIALGRELHELAPGVGSEARAWRVLDLETASGLPLQSVRADSAGRLWVGTESGLLLRENGSWRSLSTAQGLAAGPVTPLVEDRDGYLWIAAQSALCRIAPVPIVSYTAAEGLPHPIVLGIVEGIDGRIYVNTPGGFGLVDGERVSLVQGSDALPFRALARRVVRSRSGDWWVLLDDALLRFNGPQLRFDTPVQRIATRRGFSAPFAQPGTSRSPGMYEDAAGRVLVATSDGGFYWIDRSGAVSRIEPATPAQSPGAGLVPGLADGAGNIWLSSMDTLARLRPGGLERIAPTSGLPTTSVRSLHLDAKGRLWIGLRSGGVTMVRDPAADRLEFVNYSTRNGLASDAVWSIAADSAGRLYLATSRGLDRLDPESGRVRHFTTVDGLPSNYATYCLRDARGFIWVGTINGLARIDPRAERTAAAPPPVYITRVQFAGEDVPVRIGARAEGEELRLPWSRNQLHIEYAGVSPGRDRGFRYQYRLDGLSPDWSAATDQRAITFAQLPAGRFRFEVRAIDWDGATSQPTSALSVRILPPIWRRWWFVMLGLAVVMRSAVSVHRFRLRHVLATERVRRQVATDLHDDLGSGLSQIAILSEVAKRQEAASHLETIAGLARSMRASIDDIVWAVDPRADRLTDLAQRIRQVAANALGTDGMSVDVLMPSERDLQRVNLGPDKRRHVLLVAKEAITNIARHANASSVKISLEIERRYLHLAVRDDGRGFVSDASYEGQGLRSLERRAAELNAQLRIESAPGRGTLVALRVPLA